MKFRRLVLFATLLVLRSNCAAQRDPKPENATAAVLHAFDTHEIVILGEIHGNKQSLVVLPSSNNARLRSFNLQEKNMTPSTLTTAPSSSLPAGASGPIVFVGRVLFALIFLMAGPNHFVSSTIAFAASQGVPMASIAVPFSGALALIGGLSIVLGYRAKIGAWLIVLFLACVTPMLHKFWTVTDPMMHQIQMIMFMKNLSMLGGALLISQFGAGPWSVDARRK